MGFDVVAVPGEFGSRVLMLVLFPRQQWGLEGDFYDGSCSAVPLGLEQGFGDLFVYVPDKYGPEEVKLMVVGNMVWFRVQSGQKFGLC